MEHDHDFLKDRTAVVTGAAGGIGVAICSRLAQSGINLLMIGRKEHKLNALSEKLVPFGGRYEYLAGDLTDLAFVDDVISTAEMRFGGFDFLINNAGIAHHSSMEEMTPEEFDAIMQINVRAPYFLCSRSLRVLRKSQLATIINLCSASSHKGYPNQSVYVASKHALLGMSKSLANEVYQENIRVHCISPGGVFTDMITLVRPDLTDEGMIQPDDIASIVAFFLENRRSNAVIDEVRVNRCTKAPFS